MAGNPDEYIAAEVRDLVKQSTSTWKESPKASDDVLRKVCKSSAVVHARNLFSNVSKAIMPINIYLVMIAMISALT